MTDPTARTWPARNAAGDARSLTVDAPHNEIVRVTINPCGPLAGLRLAAFLTTADAREVRDHLTDLVGEAAPSASYVERSTRGMIEERTGILRERDLARRETRAAKADLTNARAELAEAKDALAASRADEAEGCRFWGSVTAAGTTELADLRASLAAANDTAASLLDALAAANAERDRLRATLAELRDDADSLANTADTALRAVDGFDYAGVEAALLLGDTFTARAALTRTAGARGALTVTGRTPTDPDRQSFSTFGQLSGFARLYGASRPAGHTTNVVL